MASAQQDQQQLISVGLVRLNVNLTARDAALLTASASCVSERLYVVLRGPAWSTFSIDRVQQRLAFVYQHVARLAPHIDVRIVMPCMNYEVAPGASEVDTLLGEASEEAELDGLNALRSSLGLSSLAFAAITPAEVDQVEVTQRLAAIDGGRTVECAPASVFRHVCVGGTFDYMHVGHKLLLSLSAYSASERLVCGVSDTPLLKKKVLRELMQPIGLRVALVEEFLRAIKPGLSCELSALQDGYGPAIVDPRLEAIVVSAETAKGGEACNVKRAEKSMGAMAVVVMPLVDEGQAESGAAIAEETKVSSTDRRRAQLGRMRGGEAHWCRRSPPGSPYVIGLTGGIASGKSTCRRLLLELAAGTPQAQGGGGGGGDQVVELDCDRLAHEAYLPGTETYHALIRAFGEGIVSQAEAGGDPVARPIDRKALGALVFADPGAMKRLCAITWPATAALARERIQESGAAVVILEAAVLLEAGWDVFVDEGARPSLLSPPDAPISARTLHIRLCATLSSHPTLTHCLPALFASRVPPPLHAQCGS